MSKALRIVTEEMSPTLSNFPGWYPYYATDAAGIPPPCFHEFITLMRCVNNKNKQNNIDCYQHYLNLLHCLHG